MTLTIIRQRTTADAVRFDMVRAPDLYLLPHVPMLRPDELTDSPCWSASGAAPWSHRDTGDKARRRGEARRSAVRDRRRTSAAGRARRRAVQAPPEQGRDGPYPPRAPRSRA